MRRPLSLLLAGLCLLVSLSALAAEPRHDLVRVSLADPAASEWLRLHQNELDVVFVKPGVEAHIAAQPGDEAILRAAGLVPEVMQRDMELAAAYPDKGVGFGIFHTYSENVAFMDSLRLLYPNVISAKWSIGTTYQGRYIWAYRVSDNPDVDENEPEVLIDGMHHAREIMATEFPIMFAEYLCENYGDRPGDHLAGRQPRAVPGPDREPRRRRLQRADRPRRRRHVAQEPPPQRAASSAST